MLGNPHVCGGILLTYNPATILTAAHCVADAKPPPAGKSSPFFVGYKAAERAKHTYNPIEDWVTHPAYVINDNGDVDMHYDMAIVKLAHPIEPSKHLNRVALWPANKTLPQYTRGSLMGFGYTGIDEPEADILQRTTLGVTQFSPGTSNMVEAVASHDDSLACHGDSGSPLVVHEVMHSNNTAVLVPRVLGLLARIFGVHDVNEERATCPTPFESNTTQPSIIESFCNLSNVLPWISNETGLTVDELTDPFYEP
ncbi:trypsin-like cysteine/serine peptidase domain-containing protein, partial [Syncephalastrum racemosum]